METNTPALTEMQSSMIIEATLVSTMISLIILLGEFITLIISLVLFLGGVAMQSWFTVAGGILIFISTRFAFIPKIIKIIILSIFTGLIYEIVTFTGAADKELIISNWVSYGVPVILFIGVPIVVAATLMSRRKKVASTETTGLQGLIINSIICLIYGYCAAYLMVPALPLIKF